MELILPTCHLSNSFTITLPYPFPLELKGLIKTLPRKMAWNGFSFYQYQGCWIPSSAIQGTTWLKALAFSIVNRDHYAPAQSPLLTSSPHALVPCCEFDLFENDLNSINLDGLASPRILQPMRPIIMILQLR
ncbi:hypothetical protein AAG906_022053 [Vitis piasezkii]